MTSIIVTSIIILLLVIIGLVIANKIVNGELKVEKEKNKRYEEAVNNLSQEVSKTKQAAEITDKNRRVANEKVNDLHSGNTLLNAIKRLSVSKTGNS